MHLRMVCLFFILICFHYNIAYFYSETFLHCYNYKVSNKTKEGSILSSILQMELKNFALLLGIKNYFNFNTHYSVDRYLPVGGWWGLPLVGNTRSRKEIFIVSQAELDMISKVFICRTQATAANPNSKGSCITRWQQITVI